MNILAIDPGKHYHYYSSWHNSKLMEYGKIDRNKLETIKTLMEGHDLIYIEDQYISPKRLKRPGDIIALIRASSELLTIAKLLKKPVSTVSPRKWQSAVLKAGKIDRKEIKRRSREEASKIAENKITNHNIADAICIGLYVTHILQLHA